MTLFWVLLWFLRLDVARLSGPDECGFSESSGLQSVSPLLESLQCHNDYESRVLCEWTRPRNETLQLWFMTEDGSELCSPYDSADENTSNCRFETEDLAIGITHTAFFSQESLNLCSSGPNSLLNLQHHLRALPPVNLSTHDAGGGARRLDWNSPYPSSSSLSRNLTYQLSYRTHRQDSWTAQEVKNTSVRLEKSSLLSGHRYEAKVRVRASVGQWSEWSPVVTWSTEPDVPHLPTLHCVLHGEKEVMCSWEVREELARFITYHLACQRKQTAPDESCCKNLTISSGLGGTVLRYSCLLTDSEYQLLSFKPMRSTKEFETHKHIRPKRPQLLRIKEENNNWILDWDDPVVETLKDSLGYQVCYYRKQDQESSVMMNISEGRTSVTIEGALLTPSQEYRVMVRSLIIPGPFTSYSGIPSEWSEPLDWTSNEETRSYTTLTYILVSVFMAVILIAVSFTIPTCQRKLLLWVDSVPSPRKSKIIFEIKTDISRTLMQSENPSISKVQQLDSLSTGSCDVLLWPSKDSEGKGQSEDSWSCDDQPDVEVNSPDTSSISFSGPYIFLESPQQVMRSTEVKREDKDSSCSPPVNFNMYGQGYVWLPHVVSTSAEELTSHSDDGTKPSLSTVEDGQPCPGASLQSGDLSDSSSEDRPPEYTPEPFMPWPQAGTIQPSGYCHLPAPCMPPAE